MAILLKHQSLAEFVSRLREAYRSSSTDRTIQIAKFILVKLSSGDITDVQCRNAFNLSVTQWNTLKTKMQNWVSNYNSIQTAQGE